MIDPAFGQALGLSLILATTASLVLLLIGLPLGWALARHRFVGKKLIESVLLLPLALPPTVLGFYLLIFLGPSGPLGLNWAFRFEGLVVGSVLFSMPFVLTAYREAFRAIDKELLEVAGLYGAHWSQTWRWVILPMARKGIVGGTLLTFAHTLGEFGVVLMIGGSIPGQTQTASIYIYSLSQSLQFDQAAQAAGILLGISMVLVYLVRTLEDWRD